MNISEQFAVLTPELAVKSVPVGPSLYDDLDRDFGGFGGHVLISSHAFESDLFITPGEGTLNREQPD
ncbi:hypothetical protein [Elongatibacter sediminis]|uniref:Uncharacterized protein n=1 Tax=Elongatibacter sediminis TaxID=3119006 RepID=A0AAW9R8X4_9GAMM